MKNEINYKQVQFIQDNDTRTFEQRMATLPFVRDEELPEWKLWWEKNLSGLDTRNVSNN